MESKTQTAIDWLMGEFGLTKEHTLYRNLVEKAKLMEKQQIKDAYYVGYEHAEHGVFPQGDDYYHKLY